MGNKNLNIITILTILLAISLSIVSYYGAFIPETYEHDSASMAAQGTGQDMVDLFLVVPLLILSLIFVHRGSKIAHFIYGGTVFYIIYSFFIYSFGVHFNHLFLLYCLTLGLSFYAFIMFISIMIKSDIQNRFEDKLPVKPIAVYFLIIAVMFYMLWLRDIVPAIINNTVPQSIHDNDLPVNPVHVLDIALVLPGLIVTAILLLKKNKFGYIFAPVYLVFIIILTIALTGMVLVMNQRGISDDASIAVIFIVLSIISMIFLYMFMKNLRKDVAL